MLTGQPPISPPICLIERSHTLKLCHFNENIVKYQLTTHQHPASLNSAELAASRTAAGYLVTLRASKYPVRLFTDKTPDAHPTPRSAQAGERRKPAITSRS